jgi:hypothetical protein
VTHQIDLFAWGPFSQGAFPRWKFSKESNSTDRQPKKTEATKWRRSKNWIVSYPQLNVSQKPDLMQEIQ